MEEDKIKYKFGQCMAHARRKKGLTQEALYQKSKFSKNTISELERGASNCRLLTMLDYAQAAGISLAEVFYEFENMPPIRSKNLQQLINLLYDQDDLTIETVLAQAKLLISYANKTKG